jgi:hypothetical protein
MICMLVLIIPHCMHIWKHCVIPYKHIAIIIYQWNINKAPIILQVITFLKLSNCRLCASAWYTSLLFEENNPATPVSFSFLPSILLFPVNPSPPIQLSSLGILNDLTVFLERLQSPHRFLPLTETQTLATIWPSYLELPRNSLGLNI